MSVDLKCYSRSDFEFEIYSLISTLKGQLTNSEGETRTFFSIYSRTFEMNVYQLI